MKYFISGFISFLLTLCSFQVEAKDFKSALKVSIQMPEKSPKEIIVVPERELGKKEVKPPVWKIDDAKFDEMIKEFKLLPKSEDTIVDCPRNNMSLELTEVKKKTKKFSCYNNSNSTRKKYVSFAHKIN